MPFTAHGSGSVSGNAATALSLNATPGASIPEFASCRGLLVCELQIRRTNTHFPKFVHRLSATFHELRKVMGTSKAMI
jgi:hypothetical protein